MSSPAIARVALLTSVVALGAAAPAQAGLPERVVHAARVELAKNVHEMPNGSNEAPAIKRYRSAVRWSSPRTAWCGYFVSYVANKAGAPLGDSGEGIGAVDAIRRWAKRAKRWRTTPRKGDVVVFRGHVGIVERVAGAGIVTIEGNHSNRVARVWRARSEARGYVRLRKVVKPKTPEPATDGFPDDLPVDAGIPADDSSADDPGTTDDSPADDEFPGDYVPGDDDPSDGQDAG